MIPRAFLIFLATVAAFGMLVGAVAVLGQRGSPWPSTRPGGDFALRDLDGRPVTQADFRGRPSAFFFGFTQCPDVCPTALFTLTQSLRALGSAADRLGVAFVTVDPERDTSETMRLYLQSFDPRIRGLRGSRRETEEMAARFHVVARRVEGRDGAYAYDHSTTVLLFDRGGRLVGGIDHDEDEALVTAKLRRLLNPNACVPGAPASLWEASVVKGAATARCD